MSLAIPTVIDSQRLSCNRLPSNMVAAMAELTGQNQKLTREINLRRQHHKRYEKGQAQGQEERGNAEPES